tara:strand:- start:2936 stop:3124 length:189 start_codon:yes stop_codon:yes gene_type:complete
MKIFKYGIMTVIFSLMLSCIPKKNKVEEIKIDSERYEIDFPEDEDLDDFPERSSDSGSEDTM